MNIDPGAITLVQTNFLQNLSSIFTAVSNYALNLLYIFAVLELVMFGLIWALQQGAGWERLFFKVLKIGLIFFIIQNYSWLLNTVISSFAQVAGLAINNGKLESVIFNPAKIWQYGYDAGLFLLQQASQNSSFGFTLVLTTLGVGILLIFGLLGIQIVVQVVGFYLVSLTALLMMPFGIFRPSSKMFDKSMQTVLQAGVRVMVIILVVGIALNVWDKFKLTDMATNLTNIGQPLGLFFTALLFWSLAVYLPKLAAMAVGEISSTFSEGGQRAMEIAGTPNVVVQPPPGGVADVRAAAAISSGMPAAIMSGSQIMQGGRGAEGAGGGAAASSAVAERPMSGGAAGALARGVLAQASAVQRSISKETVRELKKILQQVKGDKS